MENPITNAEFSPTETLEKFCREHPLTSLAVAFGLGVGLGTSKTLSGILPKIILTGGQQVLSQTTSLETFSSGAMSGALFSAATAVLKGEIRKHLVGRGKDAAENVHATA